jgi:hypothetical protein
MVLENVTTVIQDVVNPSGANEYVWIFLILGGIVGSFLGVMLPYYREKRKFGKEGIDLFFDKDFLKTGAGALVISVVVVGAIYPQLLANTDPAASYGSAFIAAATLAFTLNIGGNWIIGTNNAQAEAQLVQKKAEILLATRQFNTASQQNNNGSSGTVSNNTNTTGGPVVGGEGVTQPGSSDSDPF